MELVRIKVLTILDLLQSAAIVQKPFFFKLIKLLKSVLKQILFLLPKGETAITGRRI